jgi:GGDEF domain-containing protein
MVSIGGLHVALEAPQERYDPETGLLSAEGMDQALDVELARAARHEVPLSYILIEVAPPADAGMKLSHLAARVAEALLGGVRTEDRVARVGELRFAVLATEGGDGATLAQRLADHVRKHLRTNRGNEASMAAVGVDCQFDEMTREELVRQTETELQSAIAVAAGKQVPAASSAERSLGDLPRAS